MVPTVHYEASHWTGACLPKTAGSPPSHGQPPARSMLVISALTAGL